MAEKGAGAFLLCCCTCIFFLKFCYATLGHLAFDQSISSTSPRSLRQTNRVPNCLTMTAVSVKPLSQDVFDKFWTQKDLFSSSSIQVGLKYVMEGFIKDFKINMVGNKINLEARVYRSQCKREKLRSSQSHPGSTLFMYRTGTNLHLKGGYNAVSCIQSCLHC